MNPFAYNNGAGIVPEGAWRLSPSQASRFFDSTSQWYREFLMNESPAFTGSTMSHLGTVVHYCAEAYANDQLIDHKAIADYVNSLPPDIDKQFILDQYGIMYSTLVDNYLQYYKPQRTELFLWKEVLPGIGVGGSIDSIYGTTIVDYKTTNALNAPDKFSRPYYFQQLIYAWLCRQHNIPITTLRLCYITTNQVNRTSETTGKPLKDYPTTISTVDHVITNDDWNLIESVIDLICHSVDIWNKQPELRWALAQDYRLKSLYKAPPKLFIRT